MEDQISIDEYIVEFQEAFLPPDFAWRRGQKEAVVQIIETYLAGEIKVVILDAPVGSGKSLIALAVSWILNQMGKRGYVLASDITLQEQYEKDLRSFNINWGSVKGLDNYICVDNMEKNSMGTCRVRGVPAQKMSCYFECPYYQARDKAMDSPTAVMNYAYWLIMQNYVNQNKVMFPPGDFTICDEGHKLLDIIQNHYSPRITPKTDLKIQKLVDFFDNHGVANLSPQLSRIQELIIKIKDEENQDSLQEYLIEISQNLKQFLPAIILLKKKIKEKFPSGQPHKEWKYALSNGEWLTDLYIKISDYTQIIGKTSTRNLIKNPQLNDEIAFNCLEEGYLMKRFFLKWTGFTIIMSATFSDPKEYIKQISVNSAKYIKLESMFDFSNSPIYYYNQRRFSYKTMEQNLPWLYQTIDSILGEHPEENGIIHTASYDLTLKIYQNVSITTRKRIRIYEGTEEKRLVLEELKRNKNLILMGPSLLEGLDLKDDWSRFQIFAKVPYLSLADRFVKAKLALTPSWYKWKAALNILQGVGRSIRNENDWAITYILDASMSDLISSNPKTFPPEFMQRIRIRKE